MFLLNWSNCFEFCGFYLNEFSWIFLCTKMCGRSCLLCEARPGNDPFRLKKPWNHYRVGNQLPPPPLSAPPSSLTPNFLFRPYAFLSFFITTFYWCKNRYRQNLFKIPSMILTLDGNFKHVACVWRNNSLFGEKIRIVTALDGSWCVHLYLSYHLI